MDRRQAIDFIRRHGVVLEAAKGLEPSFAEKVAGERIRGSWWSHPKGHEIFALTQGVRDSAVVLTCTLAAGKITYIHRRLWPYFIRMAERFPGGSLDKVHEMHLTSGRHKRQDVPFPDWIPAKALLTGRTVSIQRATEEIHVWLERYGAPLP